jgi:hypothetical protein
VKKLTEIEKLKYWLDAEITFMHAMLAFILYQIVTARWQHILLIIYIILTLLYATVRVVYVSGHDKDYLKVPKKWA